MVSIARITCYTNPHQIILFLSPGAQFIGQELQAGFDTTKEGFEYHIGVNHIGHAYLTKLLLNYLKKTATKKKTSRIVSVSSMAEGGAPDDGAYVWYGGCMYCAE